MFGNLISVNFVPKDVEIDVLKAKLGFGKNTQKQSGGRRRTRKNKNALEKQEKREEETNKKGNRNV